jgi:hypothetical protein
MSSLKKHLIISHPTEYISQIKSKKSKILLKFTTIYIVHLSDCKVLVTVFPGGTIPEEKEEYGDDRASQLFEPYSEISPYT